MKVRVLSALVCATLISCFTTAAEARIENNNAMPAYGEKLGASAKPNQAKNYKSSGLVFALATTSDVAIGSSSQGKKHYTSLSQGSKKRHAKHYSKKKSYSSSRKRSRHASNRGAGGASRSCLTSSARSLLNRIESRFGPVNIVSTCRPGAVIATSGKPSKHRNGQAIDFSAPGRKAAVVQWLIANHHSGGTMTYRNMDHIHVDVGHRFVSLGANSGRG
jgi:uncharacterized protein YcbK (DUF882 family)